MEEFLKQLMGKKIDVAYGTSATVRGDVIDVKDGVLFLRDEEDKVAYVAVGRIAVVWEVKEQQTRPGFVV
ncbi:MAG TPA: MM0924 family protein [Pyrinomonadaceae bacterium]|nr:MM0924 family protein [Pyrinomonadaceae bacterium]